MAIVRVPAVCGYRLVNDEWSADFVEFIAGMEAARGSEMTYGEKDSFWLLFQSTGAAISTAKAQTFTITEEQAGSTFTIPEAIGSLAVLRNGISDEQVAFDAATHTWTFTNALTAGEVVRFIYNRS